MSLFKRRIKKPFHHKIRDTFWPRLGWRRTGRYYKHRLFRGGDAPHKIAGGLAFGVAVSFTPFLGTHVIQAIIFSMLFRVSVLAGIVGTLIGNFWTFPLIFWLNFELGSTILHSFGVEIDSLTPTHWAPPEGWPADQGYIPMLLENAPGLFWPLVVGGSITALCAWPLTYFTLYYPVKKISRRYRLRYLRNMRQRALEREQDR